MTESSDLADRIAIGARKQPINSDRKEILCNFGSRCILSKADGRELEMRARFSVYRAGKPVCEI